MFGLSFGEIMMLLIVGIVVVGPRRLPTLMRSAGHWIGKLRRMSTDLRAQSGIDDLIRQEGLERELRELRSLSRGNVFNSVLDVATGASAATAAAAVTARAPAPARLPGLPPIREREYPLIGCDASFALADDAEPPPELVTPEGTVSTADDPDDAHDPYAAADRGAAGEASS